MIKSYQTLTDLWVQGCKDLLYMPASKLSWAAGATTGVYDNLLACRSMEYDFDPGRDLWLTKHRFQKLQRDYIDYDLLPAFVEKAASMKPILAKRGTVTQMSCRVHGMVEHAKGKDNYKWGNCIFGFSFRPSQSQAGVFTMHSRTSYISYMGGYDLALAYKIAEAIARLRGDSVEDYGFRWHVDSLQWYSIKAMPFIHVYDLVDEVRDASPGKISKYPSLGITHNSYMFLQKRWDNEDPPKYGPTHRIWDLMFNRYLAGNPPASVPLTSLSLEALK